MTLRITSISLDECQRALEAGKAEAEKIGVPSAIVVLDAAGNIKGVLCMDGAPVMAYQIALDKAYTAVGMGQPTSLWEQMSNDAPSFGGAITSVPRFVPFGGGTPVTVDGNLVGSIGVSGGTMSQDVQISEAAASAVS